MACNFINFEISLKGFMIYKVKKNIPHNFELNNTQEGCLPNIWQ